MTRSEYLFSLCAYPCTVFDSAVKRIELMKNRFPADKNIQEYRYYIYLNNTCDRESITKKLEAYAHKKSKKADKFTIKFIVYRYHPVLADISFSKRQRSEKVIFVFNKN